MSDLEPTGETGTAAAGGNGIAGSLPNFPDIGWDDFAKASALAHQDLRDHLLRLAVGRSLTWSA